MRTTKYNKMSEKTVNGFHVKWAMAVTGNDRTKPKTENVSYPGPMSVGA